MGDDGWMMADVSRMIIYDGWMMTDDDRWTTTKNGRMMKNG